MKINIKHIAKLANLTLKSDEEVRLEGQLEATLEHVERLTKIDTSKTPETNEVTSLENVLREDTTRPSMTQKDALKNAKKTYNGFFVVPAVLKE